MVYQSIVNLVDSVLGWILNKIPDINLDLGGFSDSIAFLVEKGQALNSIFPIKEALIFLGIAISIKLAMLIFWGAMRAINLIRGAG